MSKEFWNESFSTSDYVYGKEPNAFIKEMSERLGQNFQIGCFAEGEGRNAVYLAERGHDVTVYDQSEEGLAKADKLAKEAGVNIQTVACDLTKAEMEPDQFDASIMVFGHVPKEDQPFLVDQMFRSVKAGGVVLFEVYSEDQLPYETGGPKSTDMLYAPGDVLKWIEGHKCLHFYYGEAERQEGARHNGVGHVIQVFVQKSE